MTISKTKNVIRALRRSVMKSPRARYPCNRIFDSTRHLTFKHFKFFRSLGTAHECFRQQEHFSFIFDIIIRYIFEIYIQLFKIALKMKRKNDDRWESDERADQTESFEKHRAASGRRPLSKLMTQRSCHVGTTRTIVIMREDSRASVSSTSLPRRRSEDVTKVEEEGGNERARERAHCHLVTTRDRGRQRSSCTHTHTHYLSVSRTHVAIEDERPVNTREDRNEGLAILCCCARGAGDAGGLDADGGCARFHEGTAVTQQVGARAR